MRRLFRFGLNVFISSALKHFKKTCGRDLCFQENDFVQGIWFKYCILFILFKILFSSQEKSEEEEEAENSEGQFSLPFYVC